jgi:hypothetical protein
MNKSNHFTGQPIFSQLTSLIPKEIVAKAVSQQGSDRYYKKFNTWHHLLTMLFSCYGQCSSLREVITGMRALEGRLRSGGIKYFPARSTFSEANAHRDSEVFEKIYFALKGHLGSFLPDSRSDLHRVYVVDSTVITLFQEVFQGTGTAYADGRRKGGLKVHMAVPLHEQHPSYIHISDGKTNDITFAKQLILPMGSTVIMDRGYRSFKQYNVWTAQQIRWITRPRERSYYTITTRRQVSANEKIDGINKDYEVLLGYPQKKTPQVKGRLIRFKDPQTKKSLEFITNDFSSSPLRISQLYKERWSIEVIFKRLKQNMPLHYFLGDNQNAIKIQIWCALIADLLLNVARQQVKRKWAFSNIVCLVRLHLFNYINLYSFLENPERCSISSPPPSKSQLNLQLSG